jgi:hypothetical protein
VLEREHKGRAWLAWHGAVLPRLKTMPTLERLQGVKRKLRRQTPQEIEAIFRAMAKGS